MTAIGIIGGVGPFAGIDLMEKILAQTRARCDQDHVPIVLHSYPDRIPDRSEFLLERPDKSPVKPLLEVLESVASAGAKVVGIPCNTAHVPLLFEPLAERATRLGVRLLNMVEETVAFVRESHPGARSVGLLATSGTYHSGVYSGAFARAGVEVILPAKDVQEELVHQAIYAPAWGLKATCRPASARAKRLLAQALLHLKERGVDAALLACSELPLAMDPEVLSGIEALDPTLALARALIRELDASKLIVIEARPGADGVGRPG